MNEPRTLTEALGRVRTKLLTLPWVDKVHGRAFVQTHELTGSDKPQVLPMALGENGEYIDCRPNDEYHSVIFFSAVDVEKNDFDRAKHNQRHAIRATRAVSLIGWANLHYAQTDSETIKVELKTVLKSVELGCVIRIGDFQDNPIGAVFRPYQVTLADTKYDRWPFFCFRIELVIQTIEL